MWDVKQLEQMQEYAQIEFYLNYVGCKVFYMKHDILKTIQVLP